MKKGGYIIIVLVAVFLLSFLASKIIDSDTNVIQDQIVIIPIKGVISSSSSSGLFEETNVGIDSVLNELKKAKQDSSIKAVVLDINSPGGTVVASREIANAVKNLDKPVVAVINEVGASGAYWVASSADVIIANELSITGSIGVISSYLQFSDLMDKYGVKYEQLTAGQYKDLGSQFKDLKQDEKIILQSKLNKVHEIFLKEVTERRNITDIRKVSTGEFFLGIEAKELGLIDKFGNRDAAIEEAKKLANSNSPRIVEFKEKRSLFDLLGQVSAKSFYFLGKGIGSEIKLDTENNYKLEAI